MCVCVCVCCGEVMGTQVKVFFTIVDLKKVDSVLREALWMVLGKLGVPEVTSCG